MIQRHTVIPFLWILSALLTFLSTATAQQPGREQIIALLRILSTIGHKRTDENLGVGLLRAPFWRQSLKCGFNTRLQFLVALGRHATTIDEYGWRRIDAQFRPLINVTLNRRGELP